jgi:hypothetical protein
MATTMAALFGRGDELRALDDALAACRRGTGQVGVLTGPADIGKTSLCDAVRARFGAAGVSVFAGTCLPDAGAEIAYAPFVTAWRGTPAGGFADLLAGVARLGPVSAGIARAWLADRVLAQLAAWSAAQPVVLVIEDVQWIDPSSRALLDALVRVAACGYHNSSQARDQGDVRCMPNDGAPKLSAFKFQGEMLEHVQTTDRKSIELETKGQVRRLG